MILNYLKIIFRTIRKYWVYATINVVGLIIGLTGSLVIYSILRYEMNFDTFHTDADSIYRVVQNNHTAEGTQYWNTTAYTLASAMRDDFPDLEVAQTAGPMKRIISLEEGGDAIKRFEVEHILFADVQYLKMFDFSEQFTNQYDFWLQGNLEDALIDPNSTVLSRRIAELYFPDEMAEGSSIIGRTLLLSNKDPLIVSGVIENPPSNTNLYYEMLISYEFFRVNNPYHANNWSGNYQGSTYVKLPADYTPERLVAQFPAFQRKYMNADDIKRIEYELKALSTLHNDDQYGASVGSYIMSKPLLYGLGIMALFLLAIASVNYVNLSTAQASKRAREVGIRKTLGSSRMGLIKQFCLETLLLTAIAGIHSYVFSGWILSQLNHTLSTINLNVQLEVTSIVYLIITVLLITLISSIYPALIISGYQPIKALKSKVSGNYGKNRALRNGLVIIQFTIVQILVVGTFIARDQMDYFKNKDLGFDSESVLVVNVPSPGANNISALSERLRNLQGVQDVSFSSGIPAEPTYQYGTSFRLSHEPVEMQREAEMKVVDLNYSNLFDLQIIAGHWLTQSNVPSDGFNGFIVNEALVEMLNLKPEEAIGRKIKINEGEAEVIGVVKDFNNQALHESITPCLLFYWGTGFFSEVAIKINYTDNMSGTLAEVQEQWSEVFPQSIFKYEFIDDYLARSYQVENMVYSTFGIATLLAMIIGGLGLYGLISFITEVKTKEIGIRRVLGAKVINVVFNLSKELALILSLAVFMGSILGWYTMQMWLDNFAHRINPGITIFIISASVTFFLAFITTSVKTFKASNRNPVESLRYE